jgi:uncharacterized protein
MSQFTITAIHPVSQERTTLIYNSKDSLLTWDDGNSVINNPKVQPEVTFPSKIETGKSDLSTIKIQLGLSCNYECDYCSQRFVPQADQTNPNDVDPFVSNMSTWYHGGEDGLGKGTRFEFWGGEPFVYWKTFKPLAEAIKKKYPNGNLSVITNGSLFDAVKNQWLDDLNFSVSVSHDGPGQPVRGPDPLEDSTAKTYILDIYKRLAPKHRFSFNAMINSKNISRVGIQEFFENLIRTELGESYLQYLIIGEGGFVDAYDEGGLENSLKDTEEEIKFREYTFNELRTGKADRFISVRQKIEGFIKSVAHGVKLDSVAQKCGMDKSDQIAVDLNGNVLTCQNVSPVSTSPSGVSHHIGHVSDLAAVEIKTATHWRDREDCSNCPVIHMCKGACMFLSGPLWDSSCNNAFSDNIVAFTAAIEMMTGLIPIYIDGPLREDRKDIYWWVNGKPQKSSRKIIPIVQG